MPRGDNLRKRAEERRALEASQAVQETVQETIEQPKQEPKDLKPANGSFSNISKEGTPLIKRLLRQSDGTLKTEWIPDPTKKYIRTDIIKIITPNLKEKEIHIAVYKSAKGIYKRRIK